MKITILAKKGESKVIKQSDGSFRVYTNTPRIKNKANQEILRLLCQHLKTAKSNLIMVSGHKNKIKVIEILK